MNNLNEKIQRRSNAAKNLDSKVLNEIIDETMDEIRDYLNIEELPNGLEGTIISLVIIKCNKLGSEGLVSEGYSGISQSYINDYPRDIMKKLNRYRKLPK